MAPSHFKVVTARPEDIDIVLGILDEAASWIPQVWILLLTFLWLGCLSLFLTGLHDFAGYALQHSCSLSSFLNRDIASLLPRRE